MLRLAFIVSHPVQYYVPLYRLLSARGDVEVKVFYTWHGGDKAVVDRGFKREFAWDIPLTDGYEFEVVPNTAKEPGTHRFWGLRNPSLVAAVLKWKPDVAVITGYAYASHVNALRRLPRAGVRVLFRGDSHLLDERGGFKSWLKRMLLRRVFSWPTGCLYVGRHNYDYFRAFGVPESKLFSCPHSIELARFAEPHEELEQRASAWRVELGIAPDRVVLLFAGKFEDKKRPVALMRAFLEMNDPRLVLIMLGDGALGGEVRAVAAAAPDRFRVLPFQNQSRMPVVYRLGDVFVLPSAYGETWGLAVNEALACGRPVLVSDKVGCAADVVEAGQTGAIFPADDWAAFRRELAALVRDPRRLLTTREAARMTAGKFDIAVTADALMHAAVGG